MMDRTLKALSLMLSYPKSELQAAMAEVGAGLAADPRIPAGTRQGLGELADWPTGWRRATTCRKRS